MPTAGKLRLLAGWMKPDQRVRYNFGSLTPAQQAALAASFTAAGQAVSQLPAWTPHATLPSPLSGAAEVAWGAGVTASPDYAQLYGHQNATIGLVPIDEITVFQPHLGPHHDPVPSAPLDVLKWCLPQSFAAQVQLRVEGNRALFIGRGPNFTANPPQATPAGVLLGVASNANWVQVKRVGGTRYVLHNGVHRVTSLAAAGHTHVPAIVSDEPDLESVVPLQNGQYRPWWSPDELRAFPHPPRILDFLNPQLTVEGVHEDLLRVIEIRLDYQQFNLPP